MITVEPNVACSSTIYSARLGHGYVNRGEAITCCVDALAEGAIHIGDMCRPCREWLVAATDSYAGRRLPWGAWAVPA